MPVNDPSSLADVSSNPARYVKSLFEAGRDVVVQRHLIQELVFLVLNDNDSVKNTCKSWFPNLTRNQLRAFILLCEIRLPI